MCDWMGWHMAYKQFLINLHPSQKVTQKVTTVRYLFTIELISWWNFHSFNIWILSNSFFIAKWWAKFSALLQICFWSSVSLFNLAICIVNCRTKTKRNSIRKSCMMSLASIKVSHLTLVFWRKKTRFTCTIAANKWASSHNLKSTFEFTQNYLPYCLLTEERCSPYTDH